MKALLKLPFNILYLFMTIRERFQLQEKKNLNYEYNLK